MKRLVASLVIVFSVLLLTPFSAEALVSVKGYYRSNGTYVAPHYRTSPDSSTSNNFSTNGYRTTGVSRATAQSWENSLNSGGYTNTVDTYWATYGMSKREKKVYYCQLNGDTESHCKSLYMKKKHK